MSKHCAYELLGAVIRSISRRIRDIRTRALENGSTVPTWRDGFGAIDGWTRAKAASDERSGR